MVERCGLGANSFVVELASNDGYLLQYFVEKRVPVLGIEPAANVAAVAGEKGVASLVEIFGKEEACGLGAPREQEEFFLGKNGLARGPGLDEFLGGGEDVFALLS